VYIDHDKELSRLYAAKIPVIMVNGQIVASLKVRESDLRNFLSKELSKAD